MASDTTVVTFVCLTLLLLSSASRGSSWPPCCTVPFAGALTPLPKYAPSVVSRAQKGECASYLELAKQCGQDKSPAQLAQFAAGKRAEFEQVG